MDTSIIIASLGRAKILGEAIARLDKQTKKPLQLIVVVHDKSDLPDVLPQEAMVLFSEKGTTIQRNRGIDACSPDSDFWLFIDDDTFLHPTYLERMERIFEANPHVAGLSGNLIRNGDVSINEADRLLLDYQDEGSGQALERGALYGCNFGVRASMASNIRFDERLVLYGWLEDADFSMNLGRHGGICYSPELICVHLMFQSGGRSNHVRFGFSQIMNPYYLCRKNKDVFPFAEVLKAHWLKSVPANCAGAIVGPSRKSRVQRLWGNLIAFRFLVAGRIVPEHACEL
ncbi:MAG: glycosyltransferase [Kiritimatiellales bacterium]|nr:glycosyltransferase [Kiritimatiellales bacterium]